MTDKQNKKTKDVYSDVRNPYLRVALWEHYNRRDFYTENPINFRDMQVDHILPECLDDPGKEKEKKRWLKKFNLPDDFELDDLLNFVPAGRFNTRKGSSINIPLAAFALEKAESKKEKIKKKIDNYQQSDGLISDAAKTRSRFSKTENPREELYNYIDILLDDVQPFDKNVIDESDRFQMSTGHVLLNGILPNTHDLKCYCSIQFQTLHIRNATFQLDSHFILYDLLPAFINHNDQEISSRSYINLTEEEYGFFNLQNATLLLHKSDIEDLCSVLDSYCEKLLKSLRKIVLDLNIENFRVHDAKIFLLKLSQENCLKLEEYIINEKPVYNHCELIMSSDDHITIRETNKSHAELHFICAPDNQFQDDNQYYYIYENLAILQQYDGPNDSHWSPDEIRDYLFTIVTKSLTYNLSQEVQEAIEFSLASGKNTIPKDIDNSGVGGKILSELINIKKDHPNHIDIQL